LILQDTILDRLRMLMTMALLMSWSWQDVAANEGVIDTQYRAGVEYRENLERYRDDPNILVRPGVLADRKNRFVDLQAAATGHGPDARLDIFIASAGTFDERALLVTAAQPDDVQDAMEFIGMAPGRPADPASGYFWPKGERVTVTVRWPVEGPASFDQSVRAERLLTDVTWNEPLPTLGFRFVGLSRRGEADDTAGFITTAFNSSSTVFEVPYLVSEREATGRLVATGEYRFSVDQPIRIRIRPEFRDSRKRVRDFLVDVTSGDSVTEERLADLAVTLLEIDGTEVVTGSFEDAFVYLDEIIGNGQEPYLQFRFADSLSVSTVRAVSQFIQQFLIKRDIRIEPNAAHLFYGAFLPNEAWRDPGRRGRSSQPLEIHWQETASTGEFRGEVVQHLQSKYATGEPKRISFANSAEFRAIINSNRPWHTDGVFMFVSPELPYREIRKAFDLLRSDFPNVYVFM